MAVETTAIQIKTGVIPTASGTDVKIVVQDFPRSKPEILINGQVLNPLIGSWGGGTLLMEINALVNGNGFRPGVFVIEKEEAERQKLSVNLLGELKARRYRAGVELLFLAGHEMLDGNRIDAATRAFEKAGSLYSDEQWQDMEQRLFIVPNGALPNLQIFDEAVCLFPSILDYPGTLGPEDFMLQALATVKDGGRIRVLSEQEDWVNRAKKFASSYTTRKLELAGEPSLFLAHTPQEIEDLSLYEILFRDRQQFYLELTVDDIISLGEVE